MKTLVSTLRRNHRLQKAIYLALAPGLLTFSMPLQANPEGAQVVIGDVGFQGMGTANLDIFNNSQTAIINWQNFSIEQGEITSIHQAATATTLNRVVSGNPSAIYGQLKAEAGNVLVINPNGVIVHAGGTVNVAGMLTVSTLDISDSEFMSGGIGRFRGNTSAGVENYGSVSSTNGDVVFLGNFLRNEGEVSALGGTVAFGAGGDILVGTGGGGVISVQAGGEGGDTGIVNSGSIDAASVELKATGNVYALAIQNDGVVRASGYNFSGGKLTLSAGPSGRIVNTGDYYARNSDGSGGQVSIEGGSVALTRGTVDASGAGGMAGGEVRVSGSDVNVGSDASIRAGGSTGGTVVLAGSESVALDGVIHAAAVDGVGGKVDVTAPTTTVGSTASIDVSGRQGGGRARVGGGFQGGEVDIANATSTSVAAGSLIIADGAEGDAGRVVVWADGDTMFQGHISAQAFGAVGNGGVVEVSGKTNLAYDGVVSTLSVGGRSGTLLLDPTNIVIGAALGGGVTITSASIVAALTTGNVVLHTASAGPDQGNITLNEGTPTYYNSNFSLSLFATGDIFINDDLQNAGSGNITLFAGWDGITGAGLFSFNPLDQAVIPAAPAITAASVRAGDFGAWGGNNGDVFVNAAGSNDVSVGSADGETNLFGNRLFVLAGNADDRGGQVGFRRLIDTVGVDTTLFNPNPNGNITLQALSDIKISSPELSTSGSARNDSHVIIGHGGSNSTSQLVNNRVGGAGAAGDISLFGDISVVSTGGAISLIGGNDRSFAQIGHGGNSIVGDKGGDILVRGASLEMRGGFLPDGNVDSTNNNGAQIGHGGGGSHGGINVDVARVGNGFTGDIYVKMSGSITGAPGFANTSGNNNNTTIIGHGGKNAGVIADATVARDIGGSQNDNAIATNLEGHSGAIYVEATTGSITFMAGSRTTDANNQGAPAQIGHGGTFAHGNHNLDVQQSGVDLDALTGLKEGVTVVAGGNITFDRLAHPTILRTDDTSYVQIGLGGYQAGGRFRGTIDVQSGGSITFRAGAGGAYAQIGHGGQHAAGTNDTTTLNARNGYATLSGDIKVEAAQDIRFFGGHSENDNYAMIGHGGTYRVADGLLGGSLVAATERGHHGNIDVQAGRDVVVQGGPEIGGVQPQIGGNRNFGLIGHGGYRSNGDHYGDITLDHGRDLFVTAGLGGYEESRTDGTNYDQAQTGDGNFAQIGHGGYQSVLHGQQDVVLAYQFNGNTLGVGIGALGSSVISITGGRNLNLTAAQSAGAPRDDHNDVIVPAVVGPPPVAEITRPFLPRILSGHAQIGHGGYGDNTSTRLPTATSVTTGDILIDVAGNVTLNGTVTQQKTGSGVAGDDAHQRNFVQIGHGGNAIRTSFSGGITLESGGNVTLQAGSTFRDPARIGHGGYDSGVLADVLTSTVVTGDISVKADGNISVLGGTGRNTSGNTQFDYAQIGHGAANRGMTVIANITVSSSGNLLVRGGLSARDAYAHIGHGGLENNDGDFSGTIDVSVGGNLDLVSRSGGLFNTVTTSGRDVTETGLTATIVRAYAKIGHGDSDSSGRTKSVGEWNGNIFVKVGTDLTSTGGMVGHASAANGDTLLRSSIGNTYIAVGRNNPSPGSGNLTTDSATLFTSARRGFGSELRLYIPGVGGDDNFIAEGTLLNEFTYTRIPDPDGTRDDESLASEFAFTYDADNLPVGSFTPEGAYDGHAFGNYNIFYFDFTAPPPGVIPVVPPRASDYAYRDFFDAFDRSKSLFVYDGYTGQLYSVSWADAMEDESDPSTGGWALENALDRRAGPRREGRVGEDPGLLEEENDEELRRRREFASRGVGRAGLTYYTFDPATNRYSSYQVFGVPTTSLPIAQ